MNLGDLIRRLEDEPDHDRVAPHGFANPHSYRGYYDQLAFEPARNVTIQSMLDCAISAIDETFTGKGGEYVMDQDTTVWLALEGCESAEWDHSFCTWQLNEMLAAARPTQVKIEVDTSKAQAQVDALKAKLVAEPKYKIIGDWLAARVDDCTCMDPGPPWPHEPSCGWEPLFKVADAVEGWALAAAAQSPAKQMPTGEEFLKRYRRPGLVSAETARPAIPPGILWYALRYALGRTSFAGNDMRRAIHAHADQLSDEDRGGMAQDIEEAIKERMWTAWDRDQWRQAAERLRGTS